MATVLSYGHGADLATQVFACELSNLYFLIFVK